MTKNNIKMTSAETMELRKNIIQIIYNWYPITINNFGQKERWVDGCPSEILRLVKGE